MSISKKKTLFECFFWRPSFLCEKNTNVFFRIASLFVCVCLCLVASVCLCVCLRLFVFVHVCLFVFVCVCLCVCLRLFVLTIVFVCSCLCLFACVLKVRFNIWLLRNMKGAREQLLDIKSKTQYQSSRCMEQCDTRPHCTRA